MRQKVAVLGVGGMLGSMILDVFAKEKNFDLVTTVRNKKEASQFKKYKCDIIELDVEYADIKTLKKALSGVSWVVNAIGVIKPYIHDDNASETERALRINALFPHYLSRAAGELGAKVIQIATDCVYSGEKGKYVESDLHDALDVYGKTKSLGEAYFENIYHLRCSIIGPERAAHLSLLDWFLSNPKNAKLNGYKNHIWNGVTTLQFAKLSAGIIKNDLELGHLQHVIPANEISKSDLLGCFAKNFGREDIKIKSVDAPKIVDRTLRTQNDDMNLALWQAAGYDQIPTVEEMVKELAEYKFAGKK